MRRGAWLAIIVVVVVAVSVAGYLVTRPRQTTVVTVGSISVGSSAFDAYRYDPAVANVSLNYKYVAFSLTPSLLDAVLRGEVDVAILPADLAAVALLQSNDTYVVGVDYQLFQGIIVPQDSNITSPAQLAGKTVAIPIGTGTYYLFVALMKGLYNLTVSPNETGPNVVHVINAQPGNVIDAVLSGSAQAGVIWEPMLSLAVVQYHMKIIATFQQMWSQLTGQPNAPFLVLVATSSFVKDRPLLIKFLEVHAESAYAWDHNETLAVDALVKFYNVPPQVAEMVWERTNNTPTSVCITQQEANELISEWEYLVQTGMIPSLPNTSRILTCQSLGLG